MSTVFVHEAATRVK